MARQVEPHQENMCRFICVYKPHQKNCPAAVLLWKIFGFGTLRLNLLWDCVTVGIYCGAVVLWCCGDFVCLHELNYPGVTGVWEV